MSAGWRCLDCGASENGLAIASGHWCPESGSYERAQSACIAMSRFLVWVWCEALATHDRHAYFDADPRLEAFKSIALDRGLLRVEFSR